MKLGRGAIIGWRTHYFVWKCGLLFIEVLPQLENNVKGFEGGKKAAEQN